jgi:Tol biopolymer transport system component
LSLEETLDIVRQLIDALSAAHERGIVHRDLKPANIKLTPDGKLKVLDFGLAKAAVTPGSSDASQLSTMVTGSDTGVILGTPAYMSPEQARGKETDARTDVWSFGCVLYEMLSGRPACSGETITDVLAKIIEGQPKWDALPEGVPDSIRLLLKAALTKEPKQRLQHIGDARLFLDGALGAGTPAITAPKSYTRRTWLATAGGLAAGALVPTTLYFLRRTEPSGETFRFERPVDGLIPNTLMISPDGELIAYVAAAEGKRMIWAGPLGRETKPLSGTEDATGLFWSPDSRQIGFFSAQQVKRTSLSGGSVGIVSANLVASPFGTWGPNDVILFSNVPVSSNSGPVIVRITARGGEPIAVTEHDPAQPAAHLAPQFLPDGEHFLFHQVTGPGRLDVRVGSLSSKDTVTVISELMLDSPARYAEPGYLLFSLNATLMAQRFDPDTRKVDGTPVPLVEQVRNTFSTSGNRRLVYWRRANDAIPSPTNRLTWFDRKGTPLSSLGDPSVYGSVALSHDERRVAVDKGSQTSPDIYILDVDRGTTERLTSHEARDTIPVWEPPGGKDRIVFASQRGNRPVQNPKLFIRSSLSSVGEDTLLYEGGPNLGSLPQDWSPEGIVFLLREGATAASWNLMLLPFPADGKPRVYLETPFRKAHAQVSPNGKWLAFTTNETGTDQIVIQSFPDATLRRRPVTASGGTFPRWRRDGRELFYLAADRKLMAVQIKDEVTMALGKQRLFSQRNCHLAHWPYLNSPAFLMTSQTTASAFF